eukprot:209326-Chlamydomonas_euryale.AAC.2
MPCGFRDYWNPERRAVSAPPGIQSAVWFPCPLGSRAPAFVCSLEPKPPSSIQSADVCLPLEPKSRTYQLRVESEPRMRVCPVLAEPK